MIDTQGGQMRAGTVTVTDSHRAGMLSVTQVIQKSSNVGVTKIALAIEPELFWGVLNRAGFGQASGIDLPGETPGQLESYRGWGAADRVTLAFGYHTNITAVQLARAYGVFASGGSGIGGDSSATVTSRYFDGTQWKTGSITYTAYNSTSSAIGANAKLILFPVDAVWSAVETCA
jgi:hypothetical protein